MTMNKPPPANIILSACAGSGKTYALIQRLLQLLKDGTPPGEILAITFTRKAAAEIHERLIQALQEQASAGEAWANTCLRRLLLAENSIDELNIFTFHGWFGLLLAGKRWSTQWYGPADICEDDMALRDEAWRRWLQKTERRPPPELAKILTTCSPYTLRQLLTDKLVHHYNAWRLRPQQELEKPDTTATQAKTINALNNFLANQLTGAPQYYQNATTAAANYVQQANADTFLKLQKAFFTNGARRKLLDKHAEKKEYLPALNAVIEAISEHARATARLRVIEFNQQICILAEEYLHALDAVKDEFHQMTFDDLEYESYRAVSACNDVNTLLYRINRRFRHILIDEFQDTSPLQWEIIRIWLNAAHGSSEAPSVFIVGDIKQAIYRFRHGDARLLAEATTFLQSRYAATIEQKNECRRCAPPLINFVNAVFQNLLPDFAAHTVTAANTHLPGRVEWRPISIAKTTAPRENAIRNPLKHARAEDLKMQQWAQTIAADIKKIVGGWRIGANDNACLATAEDILILLPQFTHVALLRNALQQQGLPCRARGGNVSFAHAFACQDIVALATVLLAPENSVSLAQVLKSPLFALSEESFSTLLATESGGKNNLWQQLLNSRQAEIKTIAEKLKQWRQWVGAGILPAHDVLVRIFNDGDILARYRAAVAPSYRQQVTADLSALLDFSLSNNGGKQPLLWQFIEALSDTPVAAENTSAGIRLMTVHGAKGLEAPIVILADCSFDKKHRGGKSGVNLLIDWQPNAAQPERFIFLPSAEKNAYEDLLIQEAEQQEHELNNLFYVALTRAQQGLVVYSFADSDNTRITELQQAMTALGTNGANNAPPSDNTLIEIGDDLTATRLATTTTSAAPTITTVPAASTPNAQQTQAMDAQRGSILHQLIALMLNGYDDAQINKLVVADPALLQEAKQLLQNEQLQQLLQHAKSYETEVEFINNGVLLRIDLLIILADRVWIIDYKTGSGSLQRYQQQMNSYRAVITATYPQLSVQAAFITPQGFVEHAA
ncbi:MAG: UvrD-helicase domain-containing protein [Proteobacteria bacterium]|nr:UvrD-helicase domain-containing protein [Pseudomonadota bacterium]